MVEGKGHCLCGVVEITVEKMNNSVEVCHCGMCRRWGGAPLMAVECGSEVLFEGEENIAVFNSSEWAERGFCKRCGSHLFYRLKENNEYQIPAGLFDNQEKFKLDLQVYIDLKPNFYSFSNKTKEMTEQEIIEKYAPEASI